MLDTKLITACNAIYDWCNQNNTPYDIVYDEDNTQGILIFRRDKQKIPQLMYAIRENLNGLYARQIPIRAGTILMFSVEAINERSFTFGDLMMNDEFVYKINQTFANDGKLPLETKEIISPSSVKDKLMLCATKMRTEAQYKDPTNAQRRSGSLYAYKDSIIKGHGDGEIADQGESEGPGGKSTSTTKGVAPVKNKPTKLEYRTQLDSILELAPPGGAVGLQGLGAEHQPGDLYKRFAQAMQALGQTLHLGGSLQDLLKQQGISWKKSTDGQAVLFFVQNAATGKPQPIARVGYETLGKPQDFQSQLMSVLDLAKGQAPGTEEQKYEAAKTMQTQIRDLSNQYAPPSDGQGAPGSGAAPPMIAPPPTAPVAPQEPAPQASPAAPVKPKAPVSGPAKPAQAKPKPVMKSTSKPSASSRSVKSVNKPMIHTP